MPVPVEEITKQRLEGWAQILKDQHATPLLLVGVGHDENIGRLAICVPEDIPQVTLIAVLREMLEVLEKRREGIS